MHARVSTIAGSPDKIADAAAMINGEVIPSAKGMPGFAGGLFLADRETGKVVGVTLWETEEAMRASEEAANKLREGAAQSTGGGIASVERFEVIAQV